MRWPLRPVLRFAQEATLRLLRLFRIFGAFRGSLGLRQVNLPYPFVCSTNRWMIPSNEPLVKKTTSCG
jgi:hypothetical protein